MQIGKYLMAALALALAACSQSPAPPDDFTDTAPPPDPIESSAPVVLATATTGNERALQASDLDAYAKGMQKEIELLKLANDTIEKTRASKDPQVLAGALMEAASVDIEQAGADAAGLSLARYGYIKDSIDRALELASLRAATAERPTDPEQRPADPYAGFNRDMAHALKAREAELYRLRTDALLIRMRMADS